jgi:AraC-like DNA-binding protein
MISQNLKQSFSVVSRCFYHKLTILSMLYFEDVTFVNGGVHPRYSVDLDRIGETFSLELCSTGGMYHQRGNGPQLSLPGAALFWHHPGDRYRYGPLANPGWWYHQWVMLTGPRVERIFAEALDPLSQHHAIPLVDADELHRLFVDLVGLVHGVHRRQGEAVAVLERIVAIIGRQQAPMPGAGAIEAVVSSVVQFPFKDWNWDREARRLGVSEAHFRRLFRTAVGTPPARFLLNRRMQAAGARLLEDRRPIHVVATALGFPDQAVFTRRFSRIHGLTPHRWRAMHAVVPIGE